MPKKKPTPKRGAKKKRAAPQAGESHQRKQERLEARRRAKEEALIAQRKRERRARALRTVGIAAVLSAIIWVAFLRQTAPTEIGGNEILSFSTSNGGQQTHAEPYTYDQETTGVNPPVSGRHDPIPLACGIHSAGIKDEKFVHTLEHGAVAILYNPKEIGEALELRDIRSIEEIVSSYPDTVLSGPYPKLPDPIVLASWSRKMPMDSFDEDDIREYIDTFRDTEPAPEFNGEDNCETTADDAYEPPEPSPSPSPTPTETETDGAAEDGQGDDAKKGGNDQADDGTADQGSGDGGGDAGGDAGGDDSGGGSPGDDGTADQGPGDN